LRALTLIVVAIALVAVAGCGGGPHGIATGSTVAGAVGDPNGDGILQRVPGERLLPRTDLAPASKARRTIASLGLLTDVHVRDEESPARVTFLDRLGAPFESTFRPQEALTGQVLAATVRALNREPLDAVVEAGDLVDNAQRNELREALAVLRGGEVDPGSGTRGYSGVQSASNPDPFYYRPDVDAPRHPGLLAAAQRPFRSPGLRAPWYPLLGNHDILVQGEVAPTPRLRALALGSRRVVAPPSGLRVTGRSSVTRGEVDRLLANGVPGRTAYAAPDPGRALMTPAEAIARLRAASGHGGTGRGRLDYSFDVGPRLRVVVLDTIRRAEGSGGIVTAAQVRWLRAQLAAAGGRWVVVVSHQPLTKTVGGAAALALLDRDPHVAAALSGDTHKNRVDPRRTAGGGYWLITTASVVDYPQQARVIRLVETANGGAAIETWMVDHDDGNGAGIARELSYLDAQGGRPRHEAGRRIDRNATLYLPGA
jgi:3',5'-cyclic AMP phosphodiesterase CpdA